MSQLAGLERLEQLSFVHVRQTMVTEDIAWIHSHFKRLIRVVGQCNHIGNHEMQPKTRV